MTRRRTLVAAMLPFALVLGLALALGSAGAQSGNPPPAPTPTPPPPPSVLGPEVNWAALPLPLPYDSPPPPTPLPAPPAAPPEAPSIPPAPVVGAAYIVQPGDNLFRIALRFGVPLDALAAANHLSNTWLIFAGQSLIIPAGNAPPDAVPVAPSPSSAPVAPAGGGQQVVVQPGDTLSAIALRFGTTVQALVAANGLANADWLSVGQVLILPAAAPQEAPSPTPAPLPSEPAPATTPPDAGLAAVGNYTVQPGDTLFRIAFRFGTTVQALVAANGLASPDLIYPGQVLAMPGGGGLAAPTPAPDPPLTSPPPITEAGQGLFIWPVTCRFVINGFSAGHPAIDVVCPTGSPIVAAAAGRVEFAGWNDYGYGNLIVIDHGNGYRTLYAHQEQLLVKGGDDVTQGQLIGLSGSTGRSNMPHLHLEIILNWQRLLPCDYLAGGC